MCAPETKIIFEQLENQDQELRNKIEQLEMACKELASRNGSGEKVRKELKRKLQRKNLLKELWTV